MKPNGTSALPSLYAGWTNELLGEAVPGEPRATCEDCAMCAPTGAAEAKALYFNPRIKCCTYLPALANFLVGATLEDAGGSSAGRATVERRIDGGVGVSPLGLERSKVYGLLYDNGTPAFGRAESLRCPHYLDEAGGRCGIWRNRNSVCATWFCKHERGAVGVAFWDRLRDLLMAVETELAAWCVLESGLDEGAIAAVFPAARVPTSSEPMSADDLDGRADPKLARERWGNWFGREREFYRECAVRVRALSWDDVLRISGPAVAARARIALSAFDALHRDALPERLTAGPLQIVSRGETGARVVTYSEYDPLELTPGVLEILPYFDGRPTARAVDAIERELGVRVQDDLLRTLADFEILVPAQGGTRTRGDKMTSRKTGGKTRPGARSGTPRLKKNTLKDLDTKDGQKVRGGGKKKPTAACTTDCITSPCATLMCEIIISS